MREQSAYLGQFLGVDALATNCCKGAQQSQGNTCPCDIHLRHLVIAATAAVAAAAEVLMGTSTQTTAVLLELVSLMRAVLLVMPALKVRRNSGPQIS